MIDFVGNVADVGGERVVARLARTAEFAQHFDVTPPFGRGRTRPHRTPVTGAGFIHVIPEEVELRKVGPRH